MAKYTSVKLFLKETQRYTKNYKTVGGKKQVNRKM